jgi:hypothetical protein
MDIELHDGELYCSYKGKNLPVQTVLAKEKNLPKPLWLDHVFVGVPVNSEVRHIMLKDYISLKYDLVFN